MQFASSAARNKNVPQAASTGNDSRTSSNSRRHSEERVNDSDSSSPAPFDTNKRADAKKIGEDLERLRRTLSPWAFVDPTKPWVLVENGSFLGYFDWVPKRARVGPWSATAICYVAALYIVAAWATAYYLSDMTGSNGSILESNKVDATLGYSPQRDTAWTISWYYQVGAFLWMNFINYLSLMGSVAGPATLTTYTVQAWTLLTVRHGLCAAAPWYPTARVWAEWIRFPVACSATITFCVWNFLVMPGLYFVALKTADHRHKFLEFAFNFRMTHIHVLNIVFCILNCGTWIDPPTKSLEWFDFYLAAMSMLFYMSGYLFVFDRLGIHIYPVFSPRLGMWTVVTWTCVIVAYLACFLVWRSYLHVEPAYG